MFQQIVFFFSFFEKFVLTNCVWAICVSVDYVFANLVSANSAIANFPKQSVAKKGFLLLLYRISWHIQSPQNPTNSNVLVGKGRPKVGPSRPRAMKSIDLLVGKGRPMVGPSRHRAKSQKSQKWSKMIIL